MDLSPFFSQFMTDGSILYDHCGNRLEANGVNYDVEKE